MSVRCSYNRIHIGDERPIPQCTYNAEGYNKYGDPICGSCALATHTYINTRILSDVDTNSELTFDQFSKANKKRCISPRPNGFGESLEPDSKYNAEHWALAVGEECGEVIGAVLGMTGRKERKKHLTKEDVFKEIGDVGACLDLLAQSLGGSLGECMRNKFNEVSDRIGSNIKL